MEVSAKVTKDDEESEAVDDKQNLDGSQNDEDLWRGCCGPGVPRLFSKDA